MPTSLMSEIYGGEEASILVDGSPEQAARRLRQSTPRRAGLTFTDKVVGSVTPDRVSLRLRHRSARNAFAPIFRGRFEHLRGRTYLTGRFGLRRPAQVFMTVWFSLIALFCAASVVMGVVASSTKGLPIWTGIVAGGLFALGAIAFGLLGFASLRASKRLAKADADRIIDHVNSSFANDAV